MSSIAEMHPDRHPPEPPLRGPVSPSVELFYIDHVAETLARRIYHQAGLVLGSDVPLAKREGLRQIAQRAFAEATALIAGPGTEAHE